MCCSFLSLHLLCCSMLCPQCTLCQPGELFFLALYVCSLSFSFSAAVGKGCSAQKVIYSFVVACTCIFKFVACVLDLYKNYCNYLHQNYFHCTFLKFFCYQYASTTPHLTSPYLTILYLILPLLTSPYLTLQCYHLSISIVISTHTFHQAVRFN